MAWSCALSQQLFDVLRDDVDLEVDGRTRGGRPERGPGEGRRDEADGERGPVDLDDGEGHPVDGDGALRDDVPGQVCRQGDPHDLPLLTGVRSSTVPVPSTWPCTRCPPSRACKVTGRSRFTGLPASRAP